MAVGVTMEHDDDIYELSPDEELGPSQKKRSGQVFRTGSTEGEAGLDENIIDSILANAPETEPQPKSAFEDEKKKLRLLEGKIAEAYEELEQKQQEFEPLKKEMEKRRKELKDKENQIQSIVEELEGKKQENDEIKKKLLKQEMKTSQLQDELELREKAMREREQEFNLQERKFTEKLSLSQNRESQLREREQSLMLSKKEVEERDARIQESKSYLKAQIERITAEKNGIENENARLKSEKEQMQTDKRMFERKLGILKRKEEKLLQRERELEKTLTKLKRGEDRESQLERSLEEMEDKYRNKTADVEKLRNDLELQQQALAAERAQLEREKLSLKSLENSMKKKSEEQERRFEEKLIHLETTGTAPIPQEPQMKEELFDDDFSSVLSELEEAKMDETADESLDEDFNDIIEDLVQDHDESTTEGQNEVNNSLDELDDLTEVFPENDEFTKITSLEEAPPGQETLEMPSGPEPDPESGSDQTNDHFSTQQLRDIMGAQNLSPQEQEKKIAHFRSIIEHFKERGYNVIKVQRALRTNDFMLIQEQMLDFMKRVQRLKEIEKELKPLDREGFEETIYVIKDKLKNPEALARIEKTVASLQKKVELQDQKLKKKKDSEFQMVTAMFRTLEQKYDLTQYSEDVYDIRTKLNNPELLDFSDLSKLSSSIKKAEYTISQKVKKKKEERLHETIKLEITEFKKKGYKVKRLDEALKIDLRRAEKLYLEYISNIDRLEELRGELEGLNTMGFEKDHAELEEMMNDPAKVDFVVDALASIKRKIRVKRIQNLDLSLKEKREEPAVMAGSLNLSETTAATPSFALGSKEEQPKFQPKAAEDIEKPKVKKCPKCKLGRIIIPPKIRPIRVKCQSCGAEFLITGDARDEDDAKKTAPNPFDGQNYGGRESKMEAPPQATPEPPKPKVVDGKCPQCGNQLIPGSDFCGFCGFRVD